MSLESSDYGFNVYSLPVISAESYTRPPLIWTRPTASLTLHYLSLYTLPLISTRPRASPTLHNCHRKLLWELWSL